jgi:hypothetical protein
MSALAVATPRPSQTRAIAWGRYALVALATVIAAVVANLLVYAIGNLVVGYDPQFVVLATTGGTILFTVVPAIVAVLLYAALLRFASDPVRLFTRIAAVVLVISVIPDFTYIPSVPGASPSQTAVLIIMHIVAALVIVSMLARFTPDVTRDRAA